MPDEVSSKPPNVRLAVVIGFFDGFFCRRVGRVFCRRPGLRAAPHELSEVAGGESLAAQGAGPRRAATGGAMNMKTWFQQLIRYMAWADRRTLESLGACAAAQGDGLPLAGHLVAAEHVWLAGSKGARPKSASGRS